MIETLVWPFAKVAFAIGWGMNRPKGSTSWTTKLPTVSTLCQGRGA